MLKESIKKFKESISKQKEQNNKKNIENLFSFAGRYAIVKCSIENYVR